jgi:cyclopropane fatty-acyl-phospholipid synthase-like methyltransferase
MVPAELMVRAVTVPADTVPQADDLLHELVPRERFEIVVHRRHASSLDAAKMGFNLTRTQSLQLHYARTLDQWAAALEAHDSEAIKIQSKEVYQRYMKYLTGCANAFRAGYIDVNQFTLAN